MTTRIVTAAALAAFTLLPGLAQAAGCDHSVSMTCKQGTVWDEATKTCVSTTS